MTESTLDRGSAEQSPQIRRVLIVTRNFTPYDGIAARRPESWARHFMSRGIEVDVIAMLQPESELYPASPRVESMDRGTIYRVAFNKPKSKSLGFFRRIERSEVFQKLSTVARLLFQTGSDLDTSIELKPLLKKLRSRNQYDWIMITMGPFELINLTKEFRRDGGDRKERLLLDFRDPPRMSLLFKKFESLDLKERVFASLVRWNIARRVKATADAVTVASAPLIEALGLQKLSSCVIKNGFESDLFEKVEGKTSPYFEITTLGTLYVEQDLEFMVTGFQDFLSELGDDALDVRFNFIGTAVNREVDDFIKSRLPCDQCRVTKRMPRPEALAIVKGSQILYYPGWLGYSGVYSGKIFEYLAAKRNILVAPNDRDVTEALLHETGAGKTANSPKEMSRTLQDWFAEWKAHGTIAYQGDDEAIAGYTREEQAELLLQFLQQ